MNSKYTEGKEHIHTWHIEKVEYIYPIGMTGALTPDEYAYLLCDCGEVIKKKVKWESL